MSLLVLFIAISSCTKRPNGVLNKREMREFLLDYHLLDGIFKAQRISDETEKNKYYQALFSKHGISKAEFDSSLVYYTKSPKKFERIYVAVNRNLEAISADVAAGKYFPVIPDSIRLKPEFKNLWTKDTVIYYTQDSAKSQLSFAVKHKKLLTQDIYHLIFKMNAFSPDTSSISGNTTFKIHYTGGIIDSTTALVTRDSVWRRYSYTVKAKQNYKIDSLSGVFYQDSLKLRKIRIDIDSIILKREFVAAWQDSLELQLDTVPLLQIDSLNMNKDSLSVSSDSLINKEIETPEKKQPGIQLRRSM